MLKKYNAVSLHKKKNSVTAVTRRLLWPLSRNVQNEFSVIVIGLEFHDHTEMQTLQTKYNLAHQEDVIGMNTF